MHGLRSFRAYACVFWVYVAMYDGIKYRSIFALSAAAISPFLTRAITDLKRKKRKQELLSRAERVLGLAQRLDAFEDTHVSAGSVAHRAAADYAVDNLATRGQKDKEDQQRSEDESDGEDSEADLDFDDLVRLYGIRTN